MTDEEAAALIHDWDLWARPNQRPPASAWDVWMLRAGRGFGKTRTGAEWVKGKAEELGAGGRIALIARTAADTREVMVEGESGILAVSPPWFRPHYEPSKRRLTWPNGCIATTYSSEKPDALRGPQHHAAWADELAAWSYLRETYDNLVMGLRLGEHPQMVVTTTPKPLVLLKELEAEAGTVLTTGTTYDNMANLSPIMRRRLGKYEGTRLGRQELYAELLDEAEGALWKRSQIDDQRVTAPPNMIRIVVAVDPAVTSGDNSDETGIVVAGRGKDQRGYILEDLSGRYTPLEWGKKVCNAYERWQADRVIGEANNGGDLVESNIRTVDTGVPYSKVWAARGKQTRAEPIASLYEQGRVSHVGAFTTLEDEMCTWEPNEGMPSPSRMDAAVWALTELDIPHTMLSEEELDDLYGESTPTAMGVARQREY